MLPQFLTDKYPTQKHYFLIPRFALRIIGFYPETEPTLRVRLWAFFNFAVLATCCFAELYYGIYYLSIDVVEAFDALCPVATSIMCLLKIACLWWYRAEFKQLIQRLRCLTETQNTVEKEKMKGRFFSLSTRLTFTMLFFGISTTKAYSLRPILKNIIRYANGKDILYDTPFKMMFPAPLLRMPIYPITFMFVMWHGYITPFSFVGVDGLFLGFCYYLTTLLKSLQLDLKYVIADMSNKTNSNAADEAKVFQALSQIIERHNEIAQLIAKFSSIFAVITLCHFVSSSMIISMSLLLFLGYGVVMYFFYTGAVTSEISLYCLGGNAVIESSEELATAAYCSYWYSHSLRVQKMILLLMIRAQRNLTIKVPFFAPSLPMLALILRFAGSLVTLAQSIL